MRTPLLLAAQADSDVDLSPVDQVVTSVEEMLSAFFSILPNLGIALVVLVVGWLIARAVRNRLEPRLAAMRTKSFGRVFARLAGVGIMFVAVLVAFPIAFPSIDALSILGGLGLLGVAAGFAFQDILSNLLAGILLILRQPFTAGDQITVNDISGTVEVITIRETMIKTFENRLVYVPNADVYKNAIEVQTAEDKIRSSLLVGVSYDDDLATARSTALEALAGVDGIYDDPAPQGYYTEFGGSSITLDLRYWTDPHQAEIRRVLDQAVEAVKRAFDAKGLDIPFEIVTLDVDEDSPLAAGRRDR